MKISVLQTEIYWEDKSTNFSNLSELISPLYGWSDIVVLPEMFNTGFSMNPGKLSEAHEGVTFDWMKKIAEKGNFGICGSYIVKEKETYFNRWVFIGPQGEYFFYDKRHLFSIGGEGRSFSKGKSRLVFNFRGFRISPYICYDLRFPVWSRNRNDYDLMIVAANWPESRRVVWNTLLGARAIENQCFVAGSNRIGTDGEGIKYCGDSVILNARGEIIAAAGINEQCFITADISIGELIDFRRKFPVSQDADDFTIS